ncbi:Type 1 glutamine amidotransferase-like domain-containing protein [Nakamurella sp. A5-74]|uniref:Type 1 glutamine amidotransferase-like domain-containing protein n=1 Tax=Nakamurella sp. A5-74 TaxID=3158264 RepID=A0AAU8DVE8_9ACTN
MKMLLTSAGVKNAAIRDRLDSMLAKPVSQSHALAIPTAGYGHPMVDPTRAHSFISGQGSETPMTELGWASVGVLELTALPSIDADRWRTWVRAADVLLVNGGDALYLAHWMRLSGLADLLPSLTDMVWVGLSAGSMVMTPRIGDDFVEWQAPSGSDEALGLVDFSIFPHLEHPRLAWNTLSNARRWATTLDGPAYAIDDDTAISVIDGEVEIVSEGQWEFLPAPKPTPASAPAEDR